MKYLKHIVSKFIFQLNIISYIFVLGAIYTTCRCIGEKVSYPDLCPPLWTLYCGRTFKHKGFPFFNMFSWFVCVFVYIYFPSSIWPNYPYTIDSCGLCFISSSSSSSWSISKKALASMLARRSRCKNQWDTQSNILYTTDRQSI